MSEVSAAEFSDWKAQPVTQEVFKKLEETKAITTEYLLHGGSLTDHAGRDTAQAVGLLRGLDMILDMRVD